LINWKLLHYFIEFFSFFFLHNFLICKFFIIIFSDPITFALMNVRDRTVCRAFSQATIVYFDLQRCSIEWQYKRASMDPLFSLILENRDSTTECTLLIRDCAQQQCLEKLTRSRTRPTFFFLKRYFRKHPYPHSSFPFNKQCYILCLGIARMCDWWKWRRIRENDIYCDLRLTSEIDNAISEIDISISFLGRGKREKEKSMLT